MRPNWNFICRPHNITSPVPQVIENLQSTGLRLAKMLSADPVRIISEVSISTFNWHHMSNPTNTTAVISLNLWFRISEIKLREISLRSLFSCNQWQLNVVYIFSDQPFLIDILSGASRLKYAPANSPVDPEDSK